MISLQDESYLCNSETHSSLSEQLVGVGCACKSGSQELLTISTVSGLADSAVVARDCQEAGSFRDLGKHSLACQPRSELPGLRSREYTSIGPPAIMNSLRIASRAALRARPAAIRAPLQRRGYAEAVNDKASRSKPRPDESRAAPDGAFSLTDFATMNRSSSAWPSPTRYDADDDVFLPKDTLLAMVIREKEEEQ